MVCIEILPFQIYGKNGSIHNRGIFRMVFYHGNDYLDNISHYASPQNEGFLVIKSSSSCLFSAAISFTDL